MPKRKSSLYVKDILNCIEHVQNYIKGISFDDFTKNFMAIEACLYNIQVIGEAVAQLPDELKTEDSGIPWALIKGMRNRLIHEYFGTDLPVVWNVISNELPSLKEQFEAVYSNLIDTDK